MLEISSSKFEDYKSPRVKLYKTLQTNLKYPQCNCFGELQIQRSDSFQYLYSLQHLFNCLLSLVDLRWWPVPLLGWGLVDQLFPWPPAEHLTGQNQFILRLHNQLLHLPTANFVFDFLDARGLKEILIRYRPILLFGWDTHGQDDLITFSDQRFGVLPVGRIRWHLLNHSKDLVV